MLIQPYPFVFIKKRFTGERPALQIKLFKFRAVTFYRYVSLFVYALNSFNAVSNSNKHKYVMWLN